MDESLDELAFLSQTAGLEVVGIETQRLNSPNPATFIGSGKVHEIKIIAESLKADMIIFDTELSPRNYRELEENFGENIRVIDRTTLILDIFAMHAQTKEGKLQVELAQYEYFLPRLTKAWSHLARQAGGGGGRTGGSGGVGLRGPGETQLEVDRRKIRARISHVKKDLEKIIQHRELYRKNRKKTQIPIIALVGYTNAGKSTLLKRLTDADVYIANQLFATLDPTTRRLVLPSGNKVLVTDTVGFIQKLPTHLIAAFRATLEEITEANLLLHIIDITHPNHKAQSQAVLQTLQEIGANHIPVIPVLNKIDRLPPSDNLPFDFPEYQQGIIISALKNIGIEKLLGEINRGLFESYAPIRVNIPYQKGDLISLFHRFGDIDSIKHGVESVAITGKIPGRLFADFERYLLNEKETNSN